MLSFLLREGWRNFASLGIIGLLCLLSLALTLSLMGITLWGYSTVEDWKAGILGRFEMEVFLAEDVDSTRAMQIAGEIRRLKHVDTVRYVSKAAAAQRFVDQFGDELFDLLDFNPLPPSLVITISRHADPSQRWSELSKEIRVMSGVEDVVFEGELLANVDRFYKMAGMWVGAALLAAILISFVFTILSVGNAIQARTDFIRLVALSGGTPLMARGPFIVMGGYYGIVSGIIASCITAAFTWIMTLGWGLGGSMRLWWLAALIGSGVAFGMLGAGWAAERRIRKLY